MEKFIITNNILEKYVGDELTSITIPESVTNIGSWAFDNCTNLGEVIFEKGAKKLQIAPDAFTKTRVKALDLTRKTYIWGENFPNVREIKNLKNLFITNFNNFDLNTTTGYNTSLMLAQQIFKNI